MPRGRSAFPALISTSKVAKSAICSRDAFAGRHSRHRLDIVALEGALARRLAMRRSRPTATLTCRRPPATEAPLCFATVIALSSSDIAPREEGILGIKATK